MGALGEERIRDYPAMQRMFKPVFRFAMQGSALFATSAIRSGHVCPCSTMRRPSLTAHAHKNTSTPFKSTVKAPCHCSIDISRLTLEHPPLTP
jgi:hypothetical protein